jgi:argonaute-like protein implicated in RNA metabolism and viral defense
MKKEDVPQQDGLTEGAREVSYAVDQTGQYLLELSAGWEAKTIALSQAWEEIAEQLRAVIKEIQSGKKSALAYHMVKNQMDLTLLSQYSGVAKWRVKRHLKPAVFSRLNTNVLTIYADLFGISVDELCRVPDEPQASFTELKQSGGEPS